MKQIRRVLVKVELRAVSVWVCETRFVFWERRVGVVSETEEGSARDAGILHEGIGSRIDCCIEGEFTRSDNFRKESRCVGIAADDGAPEIIDSNAGEKDRFESFVFFVF